MQETCVDYTKHYKFLLPTQPSILSNLPSFSGLSLPPGAAEALRPVGFVGWVPGS